MKIRDTIFEIPKRGREGRLLLQAGGGRILHSAILGCPGHTGAGFSGVVTDSQESITGASGLANSSQFFKRVPLEDLEDEWIDLAFWLAAHPKRSETAQHRLCG